MTNSLLLSGPPPCGLCQPFSQKIQELLSAYNSGHICDTLSRECVRKSLLASLVNSYRTPIGFSNHTSYIRKVYLLGTHFWRDFTIFRPFLLRLVRFVNILGGHWRVLLSLALCFELTILTIHSNDQLEEPKISRAEHDFKVLAESLFCLRLLKGKN